MAIDYFSHARFLSNLVFSALTVVLVILLIVEFYRWQVRRVKQRSIELERLVEQRTADLQQAYQRIEQASLTDPLTGLHKRRFFEQSIEADIELVLRRYHNSSQVPPQSDLIFMLLDIDYFKQVNDQYGHAAGDKVLKQVALLLKQCLRTADYCVRWGGEEFLLVARLSDRQDGMLLAEKIRTLISHHVFHISDDVRLRKTCSIGFCAFPFAPGEPEAVDLHTTLQLADSALYSAKNQGRNKSIGVTTTIAKGNANLVRQFIAEPEKTLAAGDIKYSMANTSL